MRKLFVLFVIAFSVLVLAADDSKLREACDKKNAFACLKLGVKEEDAGNIVEAARYYKLACDGYEQQGCYNVAVIAYNDPKASAKQKEKSINIIKALCKKKLKSACEAIEKLKSGEQKKDSPFDYPEYKELLSQGKYFDIYTKISKAKMMSDEFGRGLDVLKELLRVGRGGLNAPILYAQMLIATNDPKVKSTAVFVAAYTNLLLMVDKYRCHDRTNVPANVAKYQNMFKTILARLDSLSGDEKRTALELPFKMENYNYKEREFNEEICLGGMEEYREAIDRGAVGKEVPSPRGMLGKTLAINTPRPKEANRTIWLEKRLEVLAKIKKSPKLIFTTD